FALSFAVTWVPTVACDLGFRGPVRNSAQTSPLFRSRPCSVASVPCSTIAEASYGADDPHCERSSRDPGSCIGCSQGPAQGQGCGSVQLQVRGRGVAPPAARGGAG